jgi:hypothetical protein
VQQRELQIRGDDFGQKRHQHVHDEGRMAHHGASQDVEQLPMLRMRGRGSKCYASKSATCFLKVALINIF